MTLLVEMLRSPMRRPEGPFRIIDGEEGWPAFAHARDADRALLAAHDELVGFELVQVHPVLLGGDAQNTADRRAVDADTHAELVSFWARHAPSAGAFALPAAEPSPDLHALADDEERRILAAGEIRLTLWPVHREASPNLDLPFQAPFVFGSDGRGTAYAFGVGTDGPGVYELPFIPLAALEPRRVGRTVSDLLEALEAVRVGSSGRPVSRRSSATSTSASPSRTRSASWD